MKVVVGGSYHNKNWGEVKKTIEKLENAGHTVIAPGIEWEPIEKDEVYARTKSGLERINPDEEFIRFVGEKEIPKEVLQSMFYKKIFDEADAFVVVDKDGYLGETVTMEIIAATLINILDKRVLPVYFTEQPTILTVFNKGVSAFPDNLRKLLIESAAAGRSFEEEGFFITENDLQIRFLGPDEAYRELKSRGMNITQEEYDLLYPFHFELYKFMIEHPNIYNVGLLKLLELTNNKNNYFR